MRQLLSDTATRMFLDRGFDAVRVAEVAEACGVSEKTVFNYFPTKESLVLDRLECDRGVAADRPGRPGRSPGPGGAGDPGPRTGLPDRRLAGQDGPGQAAQAMRRFGDLIRVTPSLRAYQSDMMNQFVSVAAENPCRAGRDERQ